MAPLILFNYMPLTANFQPSSSILIKSDTVVLDFDLIVPGPGTAKVEWYPEFTFENPLDASTVWYRESAEEDIGNGDVRMPFSIRRFSTNGADADLPAGTYHVDVQFKRIHAFCRVQIRGLGCTARIRAPFGEQPSPA
jgi:hypothetical protein